LMLKPGGKPDAVNEPAVSGGFVPATVILLMAVPTVPTRLAVGDALMEGLVETTGTPADATVNVKARDCVPDTVVADIVRL